ncbi:MAG: rhomboid family intramembrane serine protease, partial [Gammaproteobacteria bacterium]|nr:rhomboid family intramembrane serine protease [Gammaproteobacteria bacterium]
MVTLVSLKNRRAAQALCDYLTLNRIPNELWEQTGEYNIGIVNDADLGQATRLGNDFLNAPQQKKFLEASWLVDDCASVQGSIESAGLNLPSLSDIKPLWMTYSVIFICLMVYLVGRSGLAPSLYPLLSFPVAPETAGLVELLRFVSPAFLHFSVLHIVFNLLWWWQFGGTIETHQGWLRLALVLLMTALFSNLAQAYVTGPNFGGLSGVVYGLLGYLFVYRKISRKSLLQLQSQIVI